MGKFSDEELQRFRILYFTDYPLKLIEMAQILNAEFHSGKNIRDEQSLLDALDELAKREDE
jgi:hypothetical protein